MEEQKKIERLLAHMLLHLNAQRALTFGEIRDAYDYLMEYRNIIVEQKQDKK